MTSEPFAEPTILTPGPSGSLTAGKGGLSDTAQTAIGRLGEHHDHGSLEQCLAAILSLNGMPEESIQGTVQEIMLFVLHWHHLEQASSILGMLKQLTEPKKLENTSTLESQNEEVG